MGEDRVSWIERTLRIGIPIASAIIAILSLLLTIAARKKELTCVYGGASKLVSIDPGGLNPAVKMEFNGVPISSLYKLTFRLKNTGSAAIKHEDVRDAVGIRFPQKTNLLNANVERTFPPRIPASTSLSPQEERVIIDFPLLNSGDEIDMAVYVYNSEPHLPEFEGRIVDVKQVLETETVDGSGGRPFPLHNTAVRKILYWVLVPGYCLLAALAVVGAVAIIVGYSKYLSWNKKWGAEYELLMKESARTRRESLRRAPATASPSSDPENDDEDAQVLLPGNFPTFFFRHSELTKRLKEKGIPPHPTPFAESFAGMVGGVFVLLGVAALLATTSYLAHLGLGQ